MSSSSTTAQATKPAAPAQAAKENSTQTIDFYREVVIEAPAEIAFQVVLEELGPGSEMPDGTPFPMKIEPIPGGRWYRDMGNNTGHLWGHVQVIKPGKLLELSGPLFMSYPAVNFVQYKLTAEGKGTKLQFTHRAFGLIPKSDAEGVEKGWGHGLKRIKEQAEKRAK